MNDFHKSVNLPVSQTGTQCRALFLILLSLFLSNAWAQPNAALTNIFDKPLSMADALEIAMRQNSTIAQARTDLRASEGVIIQTRAIVMPKVRVSGNYTGQDAGSIERFPFQGITQPNQVWQSDIRVQQSIYEGGRVNSALRATKLTRDQAMLNFQTAVANTLLDTRVAYDDVLLAQQEIIVQEASVKLLTRELEDVQRRFNAGTVPSFNVLRAQVELGNAQPRLIRARNSFRITKNNLSNLLGWNLPKTVWEDIPMQLSGTLEARPFDVNLPTAIGRALEKRSELGALLKSKGLRREDIINAKSGYKPSAQVFAGWEWHSPSFDSDLSRDFNGWLAGAQVSWNLFDGGLTRGKVMEAQARYERARLELDDASRHIELEVRTAYSDFIQAKEVLESQKKVQEQAEEALRLAEARIDAGSGTQLDVLGAQTSLTEARTTQIEALHDYCVALVRLERAMGENLIIK